MHIHIQKQILQVFVFLPTILGDEKHVTTKKLCFQKNIEFMVALGLSVFGIVSIKQTENSKRKRGLKSLGKKNNLLTLKLVVSFCKHQKLSSQNRFYTAGPMCKTRNHSNPELQFDLFWVPQTLAGIASF